MEDIKLIISQNIVALRRESGMTQIELAEKLSYSDKAVSKWERGESVPDITVLKAIADLFSVTVDYLITSEHSENDRRQKDEDPEKSLRRKRKHAMITGMSVILVWVIATVLFIIFDVALKDTYAHYLTFAYAVPLSCIVWLVFNSMWHNRRWNYAIISLMVWTLLVSVHLSVTAGGVNLWQIYLLGIPGQIIILLWSKIGKKG